MSKEEALGGTRTKCLSVVGRVFANLCIYNFATKTVLRPVLKKNCLLYRIGQKETVSPPELN